MRALCLFTILPVHIFLFTTLVVVSALTLFITILPVLLFLFTILVVVSAPTVSALIVVINAVAFLILFLDAFLGLSSAPTPRSVLPLLLGGPAFKAAVFN